MLLIGLILVAVQIVLLGLCFLDLGKTGIIPTKYMILGICVTVLITIYNIVSQFTKAHIFGKILAVLLAIVSMLVSFYSKGFTNMLTSITENANYKTNSISIIVLADDPASSIEQAASYTFGYNSLMDTQYTKDTLAEINNQLKTTVKSEPADSWQGLIDNLYNGKFKAIVMNEAYRNNIVELSPDFNKKTKVIFSHSIKTEVATQAAPEVNVKEKPFIIYISGNDDEGSLSEVARSDVNILCVLNPTTRQVLLVSTPRDSYVDVTNNDGLTGKEKLTHAGNFGVDGSIKALSDLFGVTINYYARINFTGTVSLIDAMGGITVDSEVDFVTCEDTSPIEYHFTVGPNECDGEKGLAFCRERQNFAIGDLQRGRNQMIAIRAMIDKVCSPTILTRYTEIMNSVSDCFMTNMPQDKISALMNDILNDPTPWNVQMYNIDAYSPGEYMPSTFWGVYYSVVIPDYDSINYAIEMIAKIENGEIFDVDKFIEEKTNPTPAPATTDTNTTAPVAAN